MQPLSSLCPLAYSVIILLCPGRRRSCLVNYSLHQLHRVFVPTDKIFALGCAAASTPHTADAPRLSGTKSSMKCTFSSIIVQGGPGESDITGIEQFTSVDTVLVPYGHLSSESGTFWVDFGPKRSWEIIQTTQSTDGSRVRPAVGHN